MQLRSIVMTVAMLTGATTLARAEEKTTMKASNPTASAIRAAIIKVIDGEDAA